MSEIVFIVSKLNFCGPNIQLCYNTAFLIGSGRKVSVVVVRKRQLANLKLLGYLEENGVQVLFPKNIYELYKYLADKQQAKRIFISYGIISELITWICCRGPKVAQLRSMLKINYISRFGLLGYLVTAIHSRLLRSLDLVISCSSAVQAAALEFGVDSVVIPNSVDLEIRRRLAPKNHINYGRTFLARKENVLLCYTIYSSVTNKNTDLVIDACLAAPGTKLIVCGETPSYLPAKYKSSDAVVFCDFVDNILDVAEISDAFISASSHEGMPNGVLEALAAGCHCFLSNIPAHKDIGGRMRDIGVSLFSDQSDLTEILSHRASDVIDGRGSDFKATTGSICKEVFSIYANGPLWVEALDKYDSKLKKLM